MENEVRDLFLGKLRKYYKKIDINTRLSENKLEILKYLKTTLQELDKVDITSQIITQVYSNLLNFKLNISSELRRDRNNLIGKIRNIEKKVPNSNKIKQQIEKSGLESRGTSVAPPIPIKDLNFTELKLNDNEVKFTNVQPQVSEEGNKIIVKIPELNILCWGYSNDIYNRVAQQFFFIYDYDYAWRRKISPYIKEIKYQE